MIRRFPDDAAYIERLDRLRDDQAYFDRSPGLSLEERVLQLEALRCEMAAIIDEWKMVLGRGG